MILKETARNCESHHISWEFGVAEFSFRTGSLVIPCTGRGTAVIYRHLVAFMGYNDSNRISNGWITCWKEQLFKGNYWWESGMWCPPSSFAIGLFCTWVNPRKNPSASMIFLWLAWIKCIYYSIFTSSTFILVVFCVFREIWPNVHYYGPGHKKWQNCRLVHFLARFFIMDRNSDAIQHDQQGSSGMLIDFPGVGDAHGAIQTDGLTGPSQESNTERRRIESRLNGFNPKDNRAWKAITEQFGVQIKQPELLSIATLVAENANIKLDRDAKRRKTVLIKWFDEHWDVIHKFIGYVVLEDRGEDGNWTKRVLDLAYFFFHSEVEMCCYLCAYAAGSRNACFMCPKREFWPASRTIRAKSVPIGRM